MALKLYKPTTAARRHTSSVDYSHLSGKPKGPRSLMVYKGKSGGRNAHGHITVRHIGGGSRKILRVIDGKRDKFDIPARVQSLEYDPNRSAFIALLAYRDGEKRYILAPANVIVGTVLTSSRGKAEIQPGNRMPLQFIPSGTFVHDIEFLPEKGGQFVRGAGSYATVMAVEGEYAILKLPSGETRRVFSNCRATVGQVSNLDHFNVRLGKAGRVRNKGIRPTVRGKVMNPVDHPHGGGEGRNPIGMKYPKTPWGKHALGVKTRKQKKPSDKFIIHRRK